MIINITLTLTLTLTPKVCVEEVLANPGAAEGNAAIYGTYVTVRVRVMVRVLSHNSASIEGLGLKFGERYGWS
jgi:hypothetical protein